MRACLISNVQTALNDASDDASGDDANAPACCPLLYPAVSPLRRPDWPAKAPERVRLERPGSAMRRPRQVPEVSSPSCLSPLGHRISRRRHAADRISGSDAAQAESYGERRECEVNACARKGMPMVRNSSMPHMTNFSSTPGKTGLDWRPYLLQLLIVTGDRHGIVSKQKNTDLRHRRRFGSNRAGMG